MLLAAALCSGCTDTPRSSPPPALTSSPPKTEADAGIIVTNLAIQQGVHLQDYQAPEVRFDTEKRVWWFNYQLKPPEMMGGFFTISVDETGKAQLIGGA